MKTIDQWADEAAAEVGHLAGKPKMRDWRDPPKLCDECGKNKPVLVNNRVFYKLPYGDWPYVYFCKTCSASVGCHHGSVYPLGRMANSKTRKARMRLHEEHLDPLWKRGGWERKRLYDEMARRMGFGAARNFHVGDLSFDECERAIQIAQGIGKMPTSGGNDFRKSRTSRLMKMKKGRTQ